MKLCKRCGEAKPLDQFHRTSKSKDGRRTVCRSCRAATGRETYDPAKSRAHYLENRDRIIAAQRKRDELRIDEKRTYDRERSRRRFAEDRERVLAESRDYYVRNRERVLARTATYYDARRADYAEWRRKWTEANPDREREKARRWREENPESVRLAWERREERLREQYVEDVVPLVVLERDDGRCGICGRDVDPNDFHVDHIVPISRGGLHNYENTQPAHPFCNLSKGARLVEELVA